MHPPKRMNVRSNSAAVAAHHAATDPCALLNQDGTDNLDTILSGATQTVFEQQHVPRGLARLNDKIVDWLGDYDFGARKAPHLQLQSLTSTDFFNANSWPILTPADRTVYTETQSVFGALYPVKEIRDAGADLPRYVFLPWRDRNGRFKYASISPPHYVVSTMVCCED